VSQPDLFERAIHPTIGTHRRSSLGSRSRRRGALRESHVPVVLDADGLNAMVDLTRELRGSATRPVVITPHPGEMARLVGRSINDVQSRRVETAREFALRHEIFVVLKGFRTVVAVPDSSVFVNDTGNPGMASAGMGDILTGMIAGLLAQDTLGTFLQRLLFAVHLHGLAGDLAAEDIGEEPLVATDLLNYVGAAWEQLRQ